MSVAPPVQADKTREAKPVLEIGALHFDFSGPSPFLKPFSSGKAQKRVEKRLRTGPLRLRKGASGRMSVKVSGEGGNGAGNVVVSIFLAARDASGTMISVSAAKRQSWDTTNYSPSRPFQNPFETASPSEDSREDTRIYPFPPRSNSHRPVGTEKERNAAEVQRRQSADDAQRREDERIRRIRSGADTSALRDGLEAALDAAFESVVSQLEKPTAPPMGAKESQ